MLDNCRLDLDKLLILKNMSLLEIKLKYKFFNIYFIGHHNSLYRSYIM